MLSLFVERGILGLGAARVRYEFFAEASSGSIGGVAQFERVFKVSLKGSLQ